MKNALKVLVENPRTTAAAVVAIAALLGVRSEAISEDKIAIILLAAGLALSADAKQDSGASGTDK
jgi:hypothetical protein